ncbi:hypothetical protein [Derxia lacustris]|uniref:hypothetical protein n=1 Tax=Derxia lacustris TaxID=764842 RepID=UPI00111C5DB6|nr:hypothetical protein [Derxia lacustris]
MHAGVGALLAGLSLAAGAVEPRLAPNPTAPVPPAAAPRPGPAAAPAPAPAMHAVPVAGGRMLVLDPPAASQRPAGAAASPAAGAPGQPPAAPPASGASTTPNRSAPPAFDSRIVNGRTVRVLRDPAAPERKAGTPVIASPPAGLREETGPNGARMLVAPAATVPDSGADAPRTRFEVQSVDAVAPGTEPSPLTLYRGR